MSRRDGNNKKKNVVKIPYQVYKSGLQDISKWAPKETFFFMLAQKVELRNKVVYLVKALLILDDEEATRHGAMTEPKEEFLRGFYLSLKRQDVMGSGLRVIANHSHPFSKDGVRFSGIDTSSFESDRKVYRDEFDGVEFLGLVWNEDASCYDGLIVNQEGFESIQELVVVGEEFIKLPLRHRGVEEYSESDRSLYSRMLIIPGWDQRKISGLNIAIVGLGGVGSLVLEQIAMHGIGESATLVLVDQDTIEASNVTRIPYASMKDISKPKVILAREYLRRSMSAPRKLSKSVGRGRERKIVALQMPVWEMKAQGALAEADVIIGCVDSELARSVLNDVSANFMIPLFDIGSGIIVGDMAGQRAIDSGGQIRISVSGVNACLKCNMGISDREIQREISLILAEKDPAERELLRRTGYLTNLNGSKEPQPSVASLNGVLASTAITMLCGYLLKGKPEFDALHLSLETYEFMKIKANPRDECDHCMKGVSNLFNGEFFAIESLMPKHDQSMPAIDKVA